uniref:Uncharacterized protein n=1 Tax=Aegilops tauschii subsp. strangulata TaxID=200361 RepID=A0A452ZBP9_AEGTS
MWRLLWQTDHTRAAGFFWEMVTVSRSASSSSYSSIAFIHSGLMPAGSLLLSFGPSFAESYSLNGLIFEH